MCQYIQFTVYLGWFYAGKNVTEGECIQSNKLEKQRLHKVAEATQNNNQAVSLSMKRGKNKMSLFGELRRRNVFRASIAYLIISWVLAQVADLVLDNIASPAWVMQAIMLVLALGFPLVIFISWAFEVTPDGLKRQSEVDSSSSMTKVTGHKLDRAITLLLALALTYFIWESRFRVEPEVIVQEVAKPELNIKAESGQTPETITTDNKAAISRQSIAVLPFDNRSNNTEDEFFVEGIHDDLLTNLSRIASLKVISRTSVSRYKDTKIPIPEIATELGVATIMEGAVQRSGSTVRINVQLIDAQTDEHLWAEIYDRKLSAENLFSIQSEISQAIADALEATLTDEETQRINTVPTTNMAAYNAYLRGRQLMASRDSKQLKLATEAFSEAVKLDPQFALAWVNLADSTGLLATYGTLDPVKANTIRQDAIDKAMAINHQLGEAYAALGSLQRDTSRITEAEVSFKRAIELNPNYASSYHWYANFLLIYPLRIQEAIDLIQKAVELDPESSIIGIALGRAYAEQGLYSLAKRQYQRVVKRDPEFGSAYYALARLEAWWLGHFDHALEYDRKAIAMNPDNIGNLSRLIYTYLELGDIKSAESVLQQMESLDSNHARTAIATVFISLIKDNSANRELINWAFPIIEATSSKPTNFMGFVEIILNNTQRARELYLAAEPGWLVPEKWEQLINTDTNIACIVSWLLINTGDEQLGTALLDQTIYFLDEALPAVIEHSDIFNPEVCYLASGDTEKALESIETQLAHNHLTNWSALHRMPMYELIRFKPRYQAAVAERERRITEQREKIAKKNTETIL